MENQKLWNEVITCFTVVIIFIIIATAVGISEEYSIKRNCIKNMPDQLAVCIQTK